MQGRLKTVLAYSTVSQMGLVLTGFALAFLVPGGRDAVVPLLGLLALHHGLNKASLFVAYGAAPGASRIRMALFALPALALSAAPLATGYVAKEALKKTLTLAELAPAVEVVLALTSTATAVLLWKALGYARRLDRRDVPLHPSWPLLVVAATVAPWGFAASVGLLPAPSLYTMWAAAWPLGLAATIVLAQRRWLRGRALTLPEGDLVVPVERVLTRWLAPRRRPPGADRAHERPAVGLDAAARIDALLRAEATQRRLPTIGVALLLVGTLLWALTYGARGG